MSSGKSSGMSPGIVYNENFWQNVRDGASATLDARLTPLTCHALGANSWKMLFGANNWKRAANALYSFIYVSIHSYIRTHLFMYAFTY